MGRAVLVGDIGGTNARLRLMCPGTRSRSRQLKGGMSEKAGGGVEPLTSGEVLHAATVPREDHETFESALRSFLSTAAACAPAVEVSSACFAVAGMVKENHCAMTNCPWVLSGAGVAEEFGIGRVAVINDFEAVGYGVAAIIGDESPGKSVYTLLDGEPEQRAPVLVLGPGTGLGVAQLFHDNARESYTVMPSEGGHADFAPRTDEQRELQAWVQSQLGYCEVESLLSGVGLERMYSFFAKGDEAEAACISAAAIAALEAGGAPSNSDVDVAAATRAVRTFLYVLGASAGNLSLTTLAQGGVFIAGGITTKLWAVAEAHGDIERGFLHEECRYNGVLKKMPLKVINEGCDIGLLGAQNFACNYI